MIILFLVSFQTFDYDIVTLLIFLAKSIERGCLGETTKCANREHCFTCDGVGCNNLMGNDTQVRMAPNSATAWTSTMALLMVPAVISLLLTQ